MIMKNNERILATYLHSDQTIIDNHFLGEKICTNSSFVLIGKFVIHILVHQRGLANTKRNNREKTKKLRKREGKKKKDRAHTYPESPRMITFKSAFLRDDIFVLFFVQNKH